MGLYKRLGVNLHKNSLTLTHSLTHSPPDTDA